MTDSFGVILHTPRKLLQDAKQNFFPIGSNYIFMMVRREECIDINAHKWSVTHFLGYEHFTANLRIMPNPN